MESTGNNPPRSELNYIGGLPFDFQSFASKGNILESITARYGAKFQARHYEDHDLVSGGTLEEFEIFSNLYTFRAIWHERFGRKNNCLRFDIETTNLQKGRRSRVLYAAKLVDEFMSFIKKKHQVDRIAFYWAGPSTDSRGKPILASTNYSQFTAEKSRLEQMYLSEGLTPDQAQAKASSEAIGATWTYQKIAYKHGFTEVEEVSTDPMGNIKGFFRRSNLKPT